MGALPTGLNPGIGGGAGASESATTSGLGIGGGGVSMFNKLRHTNEDEVINKLKAASGIPGASTTGKPGGLRGMPI